jgi:Leucine-rich repeat (LRR) protein
MINLIPQNGAVITNIDCGSSSPALGGYINISQFPNLTGFTCIGHNITGFTGSAPCGTNLTKLILTDNSISQYPDLTSNTNLRELRLDTNKIAGVAPSLSTFPNLGTGRWQENPRLSGALPDISPLSKLTSFYAIGCYLTGSIVLNSAIVDYRCDSQEGPKKIGGSIPTLPASLKYFYVYNNNITGFLPDLNTNTTLLDLKCYHNLISGTTKSTAINNTIVTYHFHENKISGAILLPSSPATCKLSNYNCATNLITGYIPSNLSSYIKLKDFHCEENYISGVIPNLPSVIADFNCGGQIGIIKITGFIPPLSTCTDLQVFHCDQNQISGSIPSLSSNTLLTDFLCHGNYITGYLPSLSTLTDLDRFNCGNNLLSGLVPNLSQNIKLATFRGYANSFIGYDGTTVPKSLINFSLNGNFLPESEVDKILIAFKNAQATTPRNTGALELGGLGNAAPSAAGIAAKNILTSYLWTVNTN